MIKLILSFIGYTLFLIGMGWLIHYRGLADTNGIYGVLGIGWMLALIFYTNLIREEIKKWNGNR